jgi:hypothetical protein
MNERHEGTELLESLHGSLEIRCIALSAISQDTYELLAQSTEQFVDTLEGLCEGLRLLSGSITLEEDQLARLRQCRDELRVVVSINAEWTQLAKAYNQVK